MMLIIVISLLLQCGGSINVELETFLKPISILEDNYLNNDEPRPNGICITLPTEINHIVKNEENRYRINCKDSDYVSKIYCPYEYPWLDQELKQQVNVPNIHYSNQCQSTKICCTNNLYFDIDSTNFNQEEFNVELLPTINNPLYKYQMKNYLNSQEKLNTYQQFTLNFIEKELKEIKDKEKLIEAENNINSEKYKTTINLIDFIFTLMLLVFCIIIISSLMAKLLQ